MFSYSIKLMNLHLNNNKNLLLLNYLLWKCNVIYTFNSFFRRYFIHINQESVLKKIHSSCYFLWLFIVVPLPILNILYTQPWKVTRYVKHFWSLFSQRHVRNDRVCQKRKRTDSRRKYKKEAVRGGICHGDGWLNDGDHPLLD